MIPYRWIKPLLFRLDPECSHTIAMNCLSFFPSQQHHLLKVNRAVTCMGLRFKHPVMLAAGFDKNADYLSALFRLGFSAIEVGTVTPQPQVGNPKPRCFRVSESQAIVNRMGFNNRGVDDLVERLAGRQFDGLIGVNIGKNKLTPNHQAVNDYRYCLQRAAAVADYITINVSSPNTPGLRDLQSIIVLSDLLQALSVERNALEEQFNKRLPLALKVTVDLSKEQLSQIIDCAIKTNIDALILSNTTINHQAIRHYQHGNETGGVSGGPLTAIAQQSLHDMKRQLDGSLELIGVGGIMSPRDAIERIDAGATLVQLYSGLIYYGPYLVRDILSHLEKADARSTAN